MTPASPAWPLVPIGPRSLSSARRHVPCVPGHRCWRGDGERLHERRGERPRRLARLEDQPHQTQSHGQEDGIQQAERWQQGVKLR